MTDLIQNPREVIFCPRGSGQGDPIVIDLKAILQTEARVREVAFVTPDKAGELLASFNVSWRDLHQHTVFLEKELNDANRSLNKIKAVLILDEVPELLKKKGLTNNEAHREAIVTLDEGYSAALDRKEEIEALISWFQGKLKSFQMAFDSVKKIMSDSAFNYLGGNSHRTSGGSGNSDVGVSEQEAKQEQYKGFGTPKY